VDSVQYSGEALDEDIFGILCGIGVSGTECEQLSFTGIIQKTLGFRLTVFEILYRYGSEIPQSGTGFVKSGRNCQTIPS